MKLFSVLKNTYKPADNVSMEHLSANLIRKSIEECCDEYLKSASDILEFEALPNAINETLEVLSMRSFQEKFEFEQISETCFRIKLRELNLMGGF